MSTLTERSAQLDYFLNQWFRRKYDEWSAGATSMEECVQQPKRGPTWPTQRNPEYRSSRWVSKLHMPMPQYRSTPCNRYPFAPYLSDGLGRRKTIFVGAFIMCIAVALQTASQSVGMFIGARFLIGFGLTFAGTAHFIILPDHY
jgi:hypothetical protein